MNEGKTRIDKTLSNNLIDLSVIQLIRAVIITKSHLYCSAPDLDWSLHCIIIYTGNFYYLIHVPTINSYIIVFIECFQGSFALIWEFEIFIPISPQNINFDLIFIILSMIWNDCGNWQLSFYNKTNAPMSLSLSYLKYWLFICILSSVLDPSYCEEAQYYQ